MIRAQALPIRFTADADSEVIAFNEAVAPLVSVIVPFYKQEAFIAETIKSVQQQTYPNIEVIVVDDGSPVPARAILSESSNIVVLRTENRGCPAARNYGFKQSSGEYLVFLDSDDRLMPGALEAQMGAFTQNPNAVLTFGALRMIDEHGHEVSPAHICRPRKNYFLKLLEGNPIGCPGATMIRRGAFVEAGLFDESFRVAEDYRLYLQLARRHELVQHSFCVVEYRVHSSSGSQDKEKMLKATMAALDRVEVENTLTSLERRRLRFGRGRWRHDFRPNDTLAYRLRSFYYRFNAMLDVLFP
jgi:glycosyltransferase involved in cell wall biosynthesis